MRSCHTIEQMEPLYYTQGIDFVRRSQAKIQNPNYHEDAMQLKRFLGETQSNELQTLKQLYGPKTFHEIKSLQLSSFHPTL